MIANVTVEKLEEKFGKEEGFRRFKEIAEAGSFGRVGRMESEIDPGSSLDLVGVLDPENKSVSESNKKKIRELAGIADAKPEGKGEKK